MPKINLRLSEEEHAVLKGWAHDSRRSIQKEAVWRLFADKSVLDVVRKHVVEEAELAERDEGQQLREKAVAPDDSFAASPSRSASSDEHFKPDPKGARK